MCIHADLIVLQHWETKPLEPWSYTPLSQIILTESLPYPNNAECQTTKREVSIFKSLVWLDNELTFRSPARKAWALPIGLPRPVADVKMNIKQAIAHTYWAVSGGAKYVPTALEMNSSIPQPHYCYTRRVVIFFKLIKKGETFNLISNPY